jgi:uncharacterized membrane protein YkoI
MRNRTKIIIAGLGAVAALSVGGAAMASGEDATVTGPEADAAISAALEATHGGTANSVERDSENGATWEVEVTQPDGSTVDVRLDADYAVVVIESDSESG